MRKRILILTANPINTEKLSLDEEVREIQHGLERAKWREQFEIASYWATRPEDLRRTLLDYEPHIVHFSGHGQGEHGLILQDNDGRTKPVAARALARLFKLFDKIIECVLLNACYSEIQANAIHQHIGYVIGMSQAIGDLAAIKFAVGFYDALGAGRGYEDAYEFGCSAIDLENMGEASTPLLLCPATPVVIHADPEEDSGMWFSRPNPDGGSSLVYHSLRDTPVRMARMKDIPPSSERARADALSSDQESGVDLEEPEGQVPLGSRYYVERPPVEQDCYSAVDRHGALIRIKAPRQMGKTSLLSRILSKAAQQGRQTARISFQEADSEIFGGLESFLQWVGASTAWQLGIPDKLETHWRGIVGAKSKCTGYFQNYLLNEIPASLALGLDDVDEIFQYPQVAADFFALLRAWHERAKNEPGWQKLRLVIVHSKEVYIPMNINQSPFNVGLAMALPELTPAQAHDLVLRHGLRLEARQFEYMTALLGGHPYLLRVALYHIRKGRLGLDEWVRVAPTEAGPYADHLRRHLLNLQDADLLPALKQVISSEQPVIIGAAEAFKLRSMGLVQLQGNAVQPLCGLYRQYFRDRLGMA